MAQEPEITLLPDLFPFMSRSAPLAPPGALLRPFDLLRDRMQR